MSVFFYSRPILVEMNWQKKPGSLKKDINSDESTLSVITTLCYNPLDGKQQWRMKEAIEA